MKCGICGVKKVKDLSQGLGPDRHLFCTECRAHQWGDRWISREDWEKEFENFVLGD